ncbi:transcription factor bHLH162-like [Nicotiana tabacum]|uniref:Transcription factor ORG3-like n=1 Tax=Nicotiana tabacum TaxID=4097 RepID=A0A1S3YXK0_TOBAC|nr:transcription factor bHLH162-like [Nicotiana tomentosiformis]XP_016456924.1 PREDICTED: transcription factor ORG3-like [Nicotiana tabacum]
MKSSSKYNISSEKPDRKTVERNRRIYMKYLCSKLISLIPPHHFKPSTEMLSQQDQVDQTITYIEQLKERVEVLKRRKDELVAQGTGERSSTSKKVMTTCTLETPAVEVRELGSTLEVILISGLKKNFALQEVINVLEEEGAQVVTAHFSTICDKVFYTIHAQVKITRLGIDASTVQLRLQNLVC